MLLTIPVISPIDVPLTAAHAMGRRLLPSARAQVVDAEYTMHEEASARQETAMYALDEIEQAAYIKEYHDSEWWRERLRMVRKRLTEEP
jgi:hypothetical protein